LECGIGSHGPCRLSPFLAESLSFFVIYFFQKSDFILVFFCEQAGLEEQNFKYLAFLFLGLCRYYEKVDRFF